MRVARLVVALGLLVAAPAWSAPATDYRFVPSDVLEISVTPQTGFDRIVTVQPDGKISYPVVGQLQAAGLTVLELAEKLRLGLNRQLVNPQVTVSLKSISSQGAGRASLLGAVVRPGVYDIKE